MGAYAPLLVIIRQDLNIAKKGIWMSNVFNVAACVVARFVVGPLGDVYGSVKVQTALLAFCGICTLFAGFVNSLAELCLMRFLIGVGGATFVITQLWPSGKLSDALAAGKREKVTVKESTRGGFTNLNSWILFVQYATCFGIESHINNGMAMYFKDTYPVSLATAGLIASLFGWMNLFARGLGGYFSDMANAKLGMQGRIIVHTLYLLAEGAILIIFSRVDSKARAATSARWPGASCSCSATAARRATATWASSSWPLLCCRSSSRSRARRSEFDSD